MPKSPRMALLPPPVRNAASSPRYPRRGEPLQYLI
jgi:hypothetical protein